MRLIALPRLTTVSRAIQWLPNTADDRRVIMRQPLPHRSFRRFALGALLATTGPLAARAADASPWAADTYSQVRLIAGTNTAGQSVLRAGIEIKLAPGWKTYWRYPGDSGVPPRFNFSGSSNVKAVHVLWPAPERMEDGAGQSIGYHGRVIMPLRVEPKNRAQPVNLHLTLSYAVCDKLCVPAEGSADLGLARAPSGEDAALAAAEAKVPRPAKLGDGVAVAVRAVRLETTGGDKPRVVVDVAAPAGVPVDLFAEGPTPQWALPLPEPKGAPAPGLKRFSFELDGLPAGASPKGAELTLTLTAGTQAIEVKTRLD
jgi:DsbC/DsbD-like thiol-disulfide interchange protein